MNQAVFLHPKNHKQKIFKSKYNLDRFGFSYSLRKYIGMKAHLRPFCNWLHGVIWYDEMIEVEDLIGPMPYRKDLNIIVSSEKQEEVCLKAGYQNVFKGGLPIIYTQDRLYKRSKDTLVCFITHSSESQKHNVIDLNYLDYLESLRNNFKEIFVSVFSLDITEEIIFEITRRGLILYYGGNPSDKLSLDRTKALLSYAEYVSSNSMDSSIGYALMYGCKVSIFNQINKYDRSNIVNSGWDKRHIERFEYFDSYEYLYGKYPELFLPIEKSITNNKLGEDLCGLSFKLNRADAKKASGWSLSEQLRNYKSAFLKRI